MNPQNIHTLFIPYFYDIDRWHNDFNDNDMLQADSSSTFSSVDSSRKSRMIREGVSIDGKLYEFSRFLSWVRYDTTVEFERYDSYSLTSLAASYYYSFLLRNGIDVCVVNSINRISLEQLCHKYNPRFVLLSTTLILEHSILRDAISKIRQNWPDAVVILGGLFLVELQKSLPREDFLDILKFYNADANVVSPNGEIPLLELLNRGTKTDILNDPNIPSTYIVSNKNVYEPKKSVDPSTNMAENYIRWNTVIPNEHLLYHTIHTRTARSCAFKCAFCNFPVNQGALTLMPIDAFEKELQEIKHCRKVRSIIFTDDTFNVPLQRFKELCKVLANYDFEWYSFFRAQYADEETVKLMKKANCKAVFLGIESADDQILKNMDKVANIDKIKRGVEQLNKHNILTHANFIVGFPGDTEETSRKLVVFLDEMNIDFFTIAPWNFVPSTPISEKRAEFGLEGAWTNWKHNTMNSKEAFALTEELIKEPKYTVHAPELSANEFWSEIMLYCNGFTKDEAQFAFRTFNKYIGHDTPATKIQNTPEYIKLHTLLKNREMPKPNNF